MSRFIPPRATTLAALLLLTAGGTVLPDAVEAQRTQKPPLHARHWMAITGKPLGATAGAMIFNQGGNAVDAAAAMLGVNATMWDTKGWGGETQALIYNPHTGKVIGVNALGVAPARATAEYYRSEGYEFPPRYGPLAAVTPGTPGGLMTMLAEWGTMSLEEVLAPSIEMAGGYPIEAQLADGIERQKDWIKEWKYSTDVFLPHLGDAEREAPHPGEIFVQEDLAETLMKLVEAEREALAQGKSRKEAIYAAYDRFYHGDVGREFVRGANEEGGLFEMSDLENWEVKIEEPVMTTYKGIEVYKLTHWVQGPMMLQTLNILETLDLNSMGYNSARYTHAIYQAMNMAFADRDFYYGDPYFPPEEPIEGLLSKEYARDRAARIDWEANDPDVRPGDPYPYQGGTNPFLEYLENWHTVKPAPDASVTDGAAGGAQANLEFASSGATTPDLVQFEADFYAGTTSIQAADEEGWVVSITPSGGWIPAVIAGETGMGMSQRAQSFVTDPADNPYNVIEPGKRPRATLTPGLALKDGKPYLSFAVQGGDSQEQNLVQFFLNMVEWDMTVQQAVEAPNMNSYQLRGSFGNHESEPGRMLLQEDTPPWIRAALRDMGYDLTFSERTSGPINAIFFDWANGSMWGGSSNHGEDYGIGW